MSKIPMTSMLSEFQFKEDLVDDLKCFVPMGIVVALCTLGTFHLKQSVPINDKWLTDIFTDHISFATIGFVFLAIPIILSAAGALNPGRVKAVLSRFGVHLTRRLLSYCSVSCGFLLGFLVVVVGHGAWTRNSNSLATAALMFLFGCFLVGLPFLSVILVETVNLPPTPKRQRVFLALFACSLMCFLMPLVLPA